MPRKAVDIGDTAAALLFMEAGMYTLDAYSTLNSSPWTAENFGGDERKMASLREYVCHAVIYSTLYCLAAAIIGHRWWPIIGSMVNNLYLVWLYRRAAARGQETKSVDWEKGQGNAN